MVEQTTLHEAVAFSGVALVLALITMRLRPEFRPQVSGTLLAIVLGLAGLAALANFAIMPSGLSISIVPRELCLLIVALGNIRILIIFVVNVLLAPCRPVPKVTLWLLVSMFHAWLPAVLKRPE